ncbi:MAG TPA: FAD-dependent monooxygenase, partial [Myxococcota bacterium]|nr:FAD-dependent monooxygenase [Myxococcota bacterium]
VVIGGSIAGLSAAQVLSSVVDEVVILEKDSLDERLSARKGAPQGRHVHALLIGGQLALEDIFPGFSEQAMAQGALRANMGNEVAWQIFGGFRPHYTSALHPLAASRPLIERELRHCALKNPKLRLRMGVEVQGYLEKDGEIQGVLLEEGEQEERLEAQIVVDCSGRASKTPAFLAALGYPGPEEEVVTSKAGYATRLYRLREDPSRSWKMMYLQPSPRTGKRGGILAPIEGGLHFCTLLGMAGDVPPTDEAGYMAFARSLSAPYLAEVLEAAEAIGPIHSFQRAENRWKHYEKLPKYLEGLLVMGDATFAPNPVYGQGMSAAALGAKALQYPDLVEICKPH